MDKFFRFNRRCNISFFFFFISFVKKKIRYRVNRNVNFHPKILVSDPSRMDAFFKFSRGGLDERRETKNLRGVYPRQIYYPDDPIYNDAQQDSRLTPTLFHRQRQKRTAVIFLFEKRVHPHRNWKVLRHIVDSRGGHMFSLRRVSSYLLVLFRGFHPIVIPKIPSQNILSISDREGKTYYRVSKGDKEKKKKRQKYTTKIKVINCCTLLPCNV